MEGSLFYPWIYSLNLVLFLTHSSYSVFIEWMDRIIENEENMEGNFSIGSEKWTIGGYLIKKIAGGILVDTLLRELQMD